MSEAWPVAAEPWAAAPRGPSPVKAAENFRHLYERAGLSLRQVGEFTGYSREHVRRQLHLLGVELRPTSLPHSRIVVRRDEDGAVRYDIEARIGEDIVWRGDIFELPAIRTVLRSLSVFVGGRGLDRAWVGVLEEGGEVTAEECRLAGVRWASLASVWHPRLAEDVVAGMVREACVRDGWEPDGEEVARRVRGLLALVAALRVGAMRGGLRFV